MVLDNKSIWGVTWISFLWSLSSLMVFSVLPAFLVDELKMGHSHIGFIEGIAISSSFASKFFAGFLSDIWQKRKPLIMLGTILSAITKPCFALCAGANMLFLTRFGDRLAKGIRSAPTDALIADLSDEKDYGKSFGLRQSVYTFGAVIGALLAMIIMLWSDNNYRLVFALSTIPAVLAIVILWLAVRPPPSSHPRSKQNFRFQRVKLSDLKQFPATFWWFMFAFFFLMLARFGEVFVSLKAKETGWAVAFLPAIIIIMDLVHAGVAIPAGRYADKISRNLVLIFGLLLTVLAQLVLAYAESSFAVVVGIVLQGLHMGVTQGLLKAQIAQSCPPELRGTAFSLFFMVSGFAIFLGNTIAGNLSQTFGLYATFLGGASFTLIAMTILYMGFFRQTAARPALNL
jgi:MFS family permease